VSELKREFIGDVSEQDGTIGTTPGLNILRLRAVCRITGLGRSSIYRMQANGQFPQRVKIGARAVGWIEREVQEWLANRAVATR
jgi:prophage regulatory protein